MSVEITRSGKDSLFINTPVMPASGTFGFGDVYRGIVNVEKLGAIVTNPVTYQPWHPAAGTRVIPLDAGVLVHTGLPNPGISKVLSKHRDMWARMPVPVIMHIVATTPEHVARCAARIESEDCIAAIELGLNDDTGPQTAENFVRALTRYTEKSVLVRLPMQNAYELAEPVAYAGAGALVVSAPPRGTARDPYSGRLVPGRIYGPIVKAMTLRMVGQLATRIDIPIIGAGGIHSPQDARDFIEAGARAVQVDSVTWVEPKMLEIIARDLGGLTVTRANDAMGDEWYLGMGDSTVARRRDAMLGEDD
jgi:dihydroorotate dehydrogenase (NAD+) catalytic subunit